MAARKSEFPTLNELLQGVQIGKRGRVTMVTEGLTPKAFRCRLGLTVIQPEELLSIRVPRQHVDQQVIRGYQRPLTISRARQVARWILEHEETYLEGMQVVEISVDDGMAFFDDGQHRAAGAVFARKPIRAVVTKRSRTQAKSLFALQSKATKVNKNVLILDSEGVVEEYIQDAVTNNDHPWNDLISMAASPGGTKRISATSAFVMINAYALGYRTQGTTHLAQLAKNRADQFDKSAADELAHLLKAFGDRQINPYAFSGTGLRAIAMAARAIMMDNESTPADRERWERHMPTFQFAKYGYIRSATDLTVQLINHWNKNKTDDKRVKL